MSCSMTQRSASGEAKPRFKHSTTEPPHSIKSVLQGFYAIINSIIHVPLCSLVYVQKNDYSQGFAPSATSKSRNEIKLTSL